MGLLVNFFEANNCDECNIKQQRINSMHGNCLPPEPQVGNIEYKLKLVNPTKQRFEHLVTQMKWRLIEGLGEAIYEIGVQDNGSLTGLTASDLEASLQTLEEMALRLGATTTVLIEGQLDNGRSVAEVLVKKGEDSIIEFVPNFFGL